MLLAEPTLSLSQTIKTLCIPNFLHSSKANDIILVAIPFLLSDEGFEKDFSILCKDNQKVANAIATGLKIEKPFCLPCFSGTRSNSLNPIFA